MTHCLFHDQHNITAHIQVSWNSKGGNSTAGVVLGIVFGIATANSTLSVPSPSANAESSPAISSFSLE